MSMPTFPDTGLDITEDQALNMILASIAMEELALSHIMNAEGEKLQYVLGTLPGMEGGCATTKELLEVNKSITNLLDAVVQNQQLLKGKMKQVLEAKEEKQRQKTEYACFSMQCPKFVWEKDRKFPWKFESGKGNKIALSKQAPYCILLDPDSLYLMQFSFHFCQREYENTCLTLQTIKDERIIPLQCFESEKRIVSGSKLFPVCTEQSMPIFFRLCYPVCQHVEKASLTIAAIG